MKTTAEGVMGEVVVMVQELWDLRVDPDRFVFVTIELGSDCGFRGPCALPEKNTGENDIVSASFSTPVTADWRDSSICAHFKLRGRINQRVCIRVWALPVSEVPWDSSSTLTREPAGSELIAECSFLADYPRGTSAEHAGWLSLWPQGAACMRILRKRKAGVLGLLSQVFAGHVHPSFAYAKENLSGEATEFTRQDSGSPWEDVCASGITTASVTDLLTAIIETDAEIGSPLSRLLIFPASAFKLTFIWWLSSSYFKQANAAAFILLICSTHAIKGFLTSSNMSCKSMGPRVSSYVTVARTRSVLAGVIMALRTRRPILAGVIVTALELLGIWLRGFSDLCDFASSREVSLSNLKLVALWSMPWMFPRVWAVTIHLVCLLAFLSALGFRLAGAISSTLIAVISVLNGRQRDSLVGRPLWVVRISLPVTEIIPST